VTTFDPQAIRYLNSVSERSHPAKVRTELDVIEPACRPLPVLTDLWDRAAEAADEAADLVGEDDIDPEDRQAAREEMAASVEELLVAVEDLEAELEERKHGGAS
jgi:hypothetical protein